MNEQLIRILKDRHGFEKWRGDKRSPRNLLFWKLFFSGHEIPGYAVLNARTVNEFGKPRCFRSTWQKVGGSSEELFNLDIYECDSRVQAHEFLMEALAQFHSTQMKLDENVIGDVGFSSPAVGSILFARANIVVSVRRAGNAELPLREIANDIDQLFVGRPTTAIQGGQTGHPAFFQASRGGESRLSGAPTIAMQRVDSGQEHVWYRFSSDTGEIELEAGIPVYKGSDRKAHELQIEGYRADGNANLQELQIQ